MNILAFEHPAFKDTKIEPFSPLKR